MKLDRMIAVRTNKTVWRDGDMCLKVFDRTYSRAGVLSEALNLARVAEIGVRVPELREVRPIDGCFTIITDYIPGKTLDRLMREDPGQRARYMELFVKTQLSVQEKTCPPLVKLRDRIRRKLPLTDLEATLRYDLISRLEAMPQTERLCHGRLRAGEPDPRRGRGDLDSRLVPRVAGKPGGGRREDVAEVHDKRRPGGRRRLCQGVERYDRKVCGRRPRMDTDNRRRGGDGRLYVGARLLS